MTKKIGLFLGVLMVLILMGNQCQEIPGIKINTGPNEKTNIEVNNDDDRKGEDKISLELKMEGANATWEFEGEAPEGFKLVWSKDSGPTYPARSNDYYKYFNDSNAREGEIDITEEEETYYVRVCKYENEACREYSNEVLVEPKDIEKDKEEEDEKEEVKDEVAETPKNETADYHLDLPKSISLSLNGNKAVWSTNAYFNKGFKLVWSKTSGPTYPTRHGDQYQYFDDPGATSGNLTPFDGEGVYYVRVCEYRDGVCGIYSNERVIQLVNSENKTGNDNQPSMVVNSISLNVSDKNATWTIDGFSSKGFKLVWSKTSGPTYPTRSGDKYQYFSNPETRSGNLSAFDGSGTYYVRVCEYLGGACGVYSNQLTIELK